MTGVVVLSLEVEGFTVTGEVVLSLEVTVTEEVVLELEGVNVTGEVVLELEGVNVTGEVVFELEGVTVTGEVVLELEGEGWPREEGGTVAATLETGTVTAVKVAMVT